MLEAKSKNIVKMTKNFVTEIFLKFFFGVTIGSQMNFRRFEELFKETPKMKNILLTIHVKYRH